MASLGAVPGVGHETVGDGNHWKVEGGVSAFEKNSFGRCMRNGLERTGRPVGSGGTAVGTWMLERVATSRGGGGRISGT